jgi:hypothetical protein
MTDWTHFLHKFKNLNVAFLILYEEKIRNVHFEEGGILYIHCETTKAEQFMFTI